MNEARRRRQPRQGTTQAREDLSADVGHQELFLKTMKRHLDEYMCQARDRHNKLREKAKFFFLKGGLDETPDPEIGVTRADAELLQPDSSNSGTDADESPTDISTMQRLLLQQAERRDFSAQLTRTVDELIGLARTGDAQMLEKLHYVAVITVAALNEIDLRRPDIARPIASRDFLWPALISRSGSSNRLTSG